MRRRINIKQHASLIFTCVSVIGVFATAAVGVWSGAKASKAVEGKEVDGVKEYVEYTWKYYVWTLMAIIGTSACIIASHRISAKQIAALSSIAAAGATTFNQYRDKVREVIGKDAERDLYEEVRAKSQMAITPALPYDEESDKDQSYLYYDGFSDRYFHLNPSRVQQAIYHLNRNFQLKQEVCVNEWYEMLGIDGVEGGDELTWVADDFWESGLTPWIDVYKIEDVRKDTGEKVTKLFFDWDPGALHEEWR